MLVLCCGGTPDNVDGLGWLGGGGIRTAADGCTAAGGGIRTAADGCTAAGGGIRAAASDTGGSGAGGAAPAAVEDDCVPAAAIVAGGWALDVRGGGGEGGV